ncbi:MAG: hypothetical protein ACK5JM_04610 [Rhodoblastus sp.]
MFKRQIRLARAHLLGLSLAGALACLAGQPALAQDKPASAAAPQGAASQVVATQVAEAPQKKARKVRKRKVRKNQNDGRRSSTGLARVSGSLEQRHQVCLAFIRRHGLNCDPWQTPTCGADSGYFRPPECVRPRSHQ